MTIFHRPSQTGRSIFGLQIVYALCESSYNIMNWKLSLRIENLDRSYPFVVIDKYLNLVDLCIELGVMRPVRSECGSSNFFSATDWNCMSEMRLVPTSRHGVQKTFLFLLKRVWEPYRIPQCTMTTYRNRCAQVCIYQSFAVLSEKFDFVRARAWSSRIGNG